MDYRPRYADKITTDSVATSPNRSTGRITLASTKCLLCGIPHNRHSFASLLLHEGRSVIYVARQLGHDARLTLTRYGHVIDELEDMPRLDAEPAIASARIAHRSDVDRTE